jgi:aryl-alcohol dehydrogenase-like predicted oxidoreductase
MHSDLSIGQKLVIGTAQFGFDYGVSNKFGVTLPGEAQRIIRAAMRCGIHEVDCAPAYGECEHVLGRILPDEMEIITKTSIAPADIVDDSATEYLETVFRDSLSRLQRRKVRGLLIHDTADLLKPGGDRIPVWLQAKKNEGYVDLVGVSVYTSEQLDWIEGYLKPDIVQLPFNILDQRLLRSGHIQGLKRRGVKGLLLMAESDLPRYFLPYVKTLNRFYEEASRRGVSPVGLALGYVINHKAIDKIVVGVNNMGQLEEILEAANVELDVEEFDNFFSNDDKLLNPSLWKL